jgi:regulator of replication initiation timing
MLSGFKNRIRAVERDLTKEYQSLEHNLGLRIKKLDRIEEAVRNIRAQQRASTTSPEVSKLRTENRLLKAELNLMQQPHSRNRHPGSAGAAVIAANVATTEHDLDRSSPVHRSDSRKGIVTRNAPATPQPSTALAATTQSQRSSTTALSDAEQDRRWVERLRELERRLKAEREARMVDRNGARKRLEERVAENMELRAELERERMRRGQQRALEGGDTSHSHGYRRAVESGPNSGSDVHRSSDGDTDAHSSYGEGITVDIEM